MTKEVNREMNDDTKDYRQKCRKLRIQMGQYTAGDCIVAFSGGVDSSVLLKLACEEAESHGTNVHAVTIQSKLHPVRDLEIAKAVAEEIGGQHHILEIRELQEAGIMKNPVDRCYRCKRYLFEQIQELARQLQVEVILEGTNEDDLHVYRPGIRAVQELGIKSPLADVHLTKSQVRMLAGELGLSVAVRPATPCLATRFPYGTELSMEKMQCVEQAEAYLRSEGFFNVRVRVHETVARIEVDGTEMAKLLEKRKDVAARLKSLGYAYITLDLEGFRSGSMDNVQSLAHIV